MSEYKTQAEIAFARLRRQTKPTKVMSELYLNYTRSLTALDATRQKIDSMQTLIQFNANRLRSTLCSREKQTMEKWQADLEGQVVRVLEHMETIERSIQCLRQFSQQDSIYSDLPVEADVVVVVKDEDEPFEAVHTSNRNKRPRQ